MRRALCGLLCVGALFATIALADDAKDEAIKKDKKLIEGTWRATELVVDGNKSQEEDAKKIKVVNASDGTWTLFSDDQEIAKGTSTFDPSQKPKTIDFMTTEGEGEGKTHLGIYELEENTRKVCFVAPGKDRPTDFTSTSGSERILVVFQREKAK